MRKKETAMTQMPRFRYARTLVKWMERYGIKHRLPETFEQVFFSGKESQADVAGYVCRYACQIGQRLDTKFEEILKSSHAFLVRYASHFKSAVDLYDALAGDGPSLALLARSVGKLPVHLEESIGDVQSLVDYAVITGQRFPESIEKKLLGTGCDKKELAPFIGRYQTVVGVLPPELEEILHHHPITLLEYCKALKRMKVEPSLALLEKLDSCSLFEYARFTCRRLPPELERLIDDPDMVVKYAVEVAKDRVPEMEAALVKSHVAACNYAFNVVRAFSSVKLPDEVHNSMVMKSFASPEDFHIKRYIAACKD
jgi:hypothetical protein